MINIDTHIGYFFSAVRFITIIPLGRSERFDPIGMTAYFPLVGLFIGFILACVDYLVGLIWPDFSVALVDVILLVIVTGALHLDGVADTADGLYGQRTSERALAIMKDSRIGPMGMIAVLCCLSLKWAGIAGLESNRFMILLLVPAYARAAILVGMRCLPYARSEGGTGSAFFEQSLPVNAFWSVALVCFLSIFLKWQAVVINLGFVLVVTVVLAYYRKKLNGITGDMLGALTEITESGLFFLLSGGILR